jgi:hypothetical protein
LAIDGKATVDQRFDDEEEVLDFTGGGDSDSGNEVCMVVRASLDNIYEPKNLYEQCLDTVLHMELGKLQNEFDWDHETVDERTESESHPGEAEEECDWCNEPLGPYSPFCPKQDCLAILHHNCVRPRFREKHNEVPPEGFNKKENGKEVKMKLDGEVGDMKRNVISMEKIYDAGGSILEKAEGVIRNETAEVIPPRRGGLLDGNVIGRLCPGCGRPYVGSVRAPCPCGLVFCNLRCRATHVCPARAEEGRLTSGSEVTGNLSATEQTEQCCKVTKCCRRAEACVRDRGHRGQHWHMGACLPWLDDDDFGMEMAKLVATIIVDESMETGNTTGPETGNTTRPETGTTARPETGNTTRPETGNTTTTETATTTKTATTTETATTAEITTDNNDPTDDGFDDLDLEVDLSLRKRDTEQRKSTTCGTVFLNDGIGVRDTVVEWGFDRAGKIRHIDIRHLFIQEGLIKGIVNRTTKLIQNTVNFRPDVGAKQGRRGKGVQRVAAMLAATLDGSAGQLVPIGRRSVSVDVSVVEHFAFGAMLLVGMVVIVLTAC